MTLPPQRWHRSPVQPGLQTQFPVFLSQWPLAVHGFAHANVEGVVVTAISGGVKAILRRSWSDDPKTDKISKMWMKTRRLHSNLDLAAMVFSWNWKNWIYLSKAFWQIVEFTFCRVNFAFLTFRPMRPFWGFGHFLASFSWLLMV